MKRLRDHSYTVFSGESYKDKFGVKIPKTKSDCSIDKYRTIVVNYPTN